MKTVLRPVLALFLSAALCVCLLPAAYADGALFTFPDGTVIREELANPDPVPAEDAEEAFGDDGYVLEVPEMGSLGDAGGAFSLPTGTTRIEAEAFAGCVGMKSVTIPGSVTSIGAGAFSGCGQLSDIYFDGTAEQWNGIRTESGNEALENALVHFRDGTLRIPVSAAYFPDEAFRSYVADTFDKDGDGWLSSTDISRVTMINCSGTAANRGTIQSLRGIELFPNLTELYCTYNRINALDVSGNKNLRLLACSYNNLDALDLSKNTALEEVYAHYNYLTALNTEKNTKLTGLYLAYNSLTGLALTKNTSLRELEVLGNKITSLDLRANTALEALYCANNQLASLKVESTKLKTLDCHGNDLTALDISKTTALEQLDCSNNLLTTLNITKCPKLQNVVNTVTPKIESGITYYYVNASSPYLIYDDFSANSGNGVPIDVYHFPDPIFRAGVLEYYDKNRDQHLSAAEAKVVDHMYMPAMNIRSLKGIEYFTSLVKLYCYSNPLTELNISALTKLQILDCRGTYIQTLNISNNVYLRGLIFNTSPVRDGATIKYSYGDAYLLWYNYDVRIYY